GRPFQAPSRGNEEALARSLELMRQGLEECTLAHSRVTLDECKGRDSRIYSTYSFAKLLALLGASDQGMFARDLARVWGRLGLLELGHDVSGRWSVLRIAAQQRCDEAFQVRGNTPGERGETRSIVGQARKPRFRRRARPRGGACQQLEHQQTELVEVDCGSEATLQDLFWCEIAWRPDEDPGV